MVRISSLQRQLRFAVVVVIGLLAAALPGFGQGRQPRAPGVGLGLPVQLSIAVTMTRYNQVSAEADRCEL